MPLKVLISGGGIAGPALAHYLARFPSSHPFYPISTTIVERASDPRTTGQAVDIRGQAVRVIQHMGIEETVASKHTTEEGIEFLDPEGNVRADFEQTGDKEKQSFTSEFEILRGDLAAVLLDDIKQRKGIETVYGETIEDIKQPSDGQGQTKVEFSNGRKPEEYDLVVLADGLTSKSRGLVFGTKRADGEDFIHFLGQYVAFFSIPKVESDTKMSQWCIFPGGHGAITRPSPYGDTRAFLCVTDPDKESERLQKYRQAMKDGQDKQMELLKEDFAECGWQTPRILKGMERSEDFYFAMIGQIKMDEFVKGRVACLGDTGYCPSPISGMGTSTALVGAYMLARSLLNITSHDAIPSALKDYQETLKPYTAEVQKLPPGGPQLANPQTKFGVEALLVAAGFASSKFVQKLMPLLPAFGKDGWKLPEDPKEKEWTAA